MTPTLSKDTRRGPGARRRVLVVVRPPLAGIVAGGSNLKSTQLLGIGVDLDIKSSFGAVTNLFLTCSTSSDRKPVRPIPLQQQHRGLALHNARPHPPSTTAKNNGMPQLRKPSHVVRPAPADGAGGSRQAGAQAEWR